MVILYCCNVKYVDFRTKIAPLTDYGKNDGSYKIIFIFILPNKLMFQFHFLVIHRINLVVIGG